MMTILGPVVVAVVSIVALLGFMALVRLRAEVAGWSAEVQRKLVHVATGLYAICLPFLYRQDWPVYLLLALAVLVMVVMRLPAFRRCGAGAALHSVKRASYGDFLLAASVALVFLLSERDPLLYVLPLAVLTLGDAAAALAGSVYGRRFFNFADDRKSVEGSAVLFLVTMILSMVCLLLFSQIPRENVVLLALMISVFGTLVEADSWRGFDNLFLPLVVLVILRAHGGSAAVDLVILALILGLVLVVFYALARRLGLSRHIARVYLAASFMLLSMTATQNAVLPLAMLAVHVVAERHAPGSDRHPELDAVATLAVLSLGWLAAGIATGLNALEFFGATMAGLCTALTALALAGQPMVRRLTMTVALGLVVVALWTWLMHLNPAEKHWAPYVSSLMIATLVLCGLVALALPGLFSRQRMVRLGALAAALPGAAFALLALIPAGDIP